MSAETYAVLQAFWWAVLVGMGVVGAFFMWLSFVFSREKRHVR